MADLATKVSDQQSSGRWRSCFHSAPWTFDQPHTDKPSSFKIGHIYLAIGGLVCPAAWNSLPTELHHKASVWWVDDVPEETENLFKNNSLCDLPLLRKQDLDRHSFQQLMFWIAANHCVAAVRRRSRFMKMRLAELQFHRGHIFVRSSMEPGSQLLEQIPTKEYILSSGTSCDTR